jgi:hypothetical protein
MIKPAYFFSLLIVLFIFFNGKNAEFNEEAGLNRPKLAVKPQHPSARASKKRPAVNRKVSPKTDTQPLKRVHFGVSLNSLTGFEKPGMPIRVFDFNGTIPVGFNATDHVLDLPLQNHLKILVDPEDIDWTRQSSRN